MRHPRWKLRSTLAPGHEISMGMGKSMDKVKNVWNLVVLQLPTSTGVPSSCHRWVSSSRRAFFLAWAAAPSNGAFGSVAAATGTDAWLMFCPRTAWNQGNAAQNRTFQAVNTHQQYISNNSQCYSQPWLLCPWAAPSPCYLLVVVRRSLRL